MFGYTRTLHEQSSIIFGVFKAEELLYAVEVNNFIIVQAKAVLNTPIPEGDMQVIKDWQNNLFLNETC